MQTRTLLLVCAGVLGAALATGATTGCGSHDTPSYASLGPAASTAGGGGSLGPSGATSGSSGTSGEPTECKKMDIVFVIDNSPSMTEEQNNLAANLPRFVKIIDDYKTKMGDPLDYRLAVTSTDDRADKGTFAVGPGPLAPAGCVAGPARPWLQRTDSNVAGFFSCRAELGTRGSGTERPLECGLLSVTERIRDNTNVSSTSRFLRDDALLAMVLITDEDEGSAGDTGSLARPMAEYPAAFDKLKGGRARWATAVIAGPSDCSSPGFGTAAEAKRLKGFITAVGKNGAFASICTGDLTDGLTKALATFDQACKAFVPPVVK